MRSFNCLTAVLLVGVGGVVSGAVAMTEAPEAIITPAPSTSNPVKVLEEMIRRQDPDALSLARVLLTAVPSWLRQIAATNLPAASSLLWEEFLDGKRPDWFLQLPDDVQSYLIQQFGPTTAVPTDIPTSAEILTETSEEASAATSAAETSGSDESSAGQSSRSPTRTGQTSATGSTQSSQTSSPTTRSQSTRPTGSTLQTSMRTASSASLDLPNAAPTDSPSAAPAVSDTGLSRAQKIGIGLGVPLAILALAAILLGFCLLCRRRHKKSVDGSIPPSSPGFIPRFAFQEKHSDNPEHLPLNRASNTTSRTSFGDTWEDDRYDPASNRAMNVSNDIPTPIMAPALYHTHSSNRARGKRTSNASLHSVAEVTEPEEVESPILPRQSPPRSSPPRNLLPLAIPAASKIKRKPVSGQYGGSPAAQAASENLLHQTMPDHNLDRGYAQKFSSPSPYVSPVEDRNPRNPFSDNYMEDFGPEYRTGYDDIDNGLYGGHTSLSRYPASTTPTRQSKTEWPLQSGSRQKRNRSPMWDRVYEG